MAVTRGKQEALRADALRLDALREVGNMSAAHAATALSRLLGEDIFIDLTDCRVVPAEDLPATQGDPEEEVAAVHMGVTGIERGDILMVFPYPMARWLSGLLLRKDEDARELDEDDQAALAEIGNICASAYLNALSRFLDDLTFLPSPPGVAVDMLAAILEYPASLVGERQGYAVVLETEFVRGEESYCGRLLFMPDAFSQDLIFSRFGLTGGKGGP